MSGYLYKINFFASDERWRNASHARHAEEARLPRRPRQAGQRPSSAQQGSAQVSDPRLIFNIHRVLSSPAMNSVFCLCLLHFPPTVLSFFVRLMQYSWFSRANREPVSLLLRPSCSVYRSQLCFDSGSTRSSMWKFTPHKIAHCFSLTVCEIYTVDWQLYGARFISILNQNNSTILDVVIFA